MFTIKHKVDGSVNQYKARLVENGFTQTYGIDYEETFSLVAKMNLIRVLLSIAPNFDWPLYQFHVKNVFLHRDLEEVYMEVTPGVEDSSCMGKVYKLKKALYGSHKNNLQDPDTEMFPWKSIWHTNVPSRVAFFGWNAALGKILTHDNLRKRSIVVVE